MEKQQAAFLEVTVTVTDAQWWVRYFLNVFTYSYFPNNVIKLQLQCGN